MEAEGKLVGDVGGDSGVLEAAVAREAVESGAVEWDELLLWRGSHGDDGGGGGLSHLFC